MSFMYLCVCVCVRLSLAVACVCACVSLDSGNVGPIFWSKSDALQPRVSNSPLQ